MELDWIKTANQEQTHYKEILSFEEYMERFASNPIRECRTNCTYIKDMFDHYGKNEKGDFILFEQEFTTSPPVFGQKECQKELYQNLLNFEEEGANNKFLLLVGPNGSSKSSLIKKVMSAAEEYSKSEEGALYTFSWIFPIDSYIKGNLGLGSAHQTRELLSYAHLEDKDITAILPSDLKDHPMLLIPQKFRQELINNHLDSETQQYSTIKNSYLYSGDMSKRNRMIYDALLKNYKGDHSEVLKHIRIERFFISKRYSQAAVTIEPQMHVDANIQQITMDKRLASLPPSLQSLNLHTMHGEVVMANRGILEFSDLLKRPLDAFKYLLMTMETQNINLKGNLTDLDIFFIGSSNEVHLNAFKQHPDYNSFKGRINFVKVPYLLDVNEEKKIYGAQVHSLKDKATFEPHAIKSLCYFSIMTRLRPPQSKHYSSKEVGNFAMSLTPLEKATFLANRELPDRFSSEQKQLLENAYDDIYHEYQYDDVYEGKFGVSPRSVKNIIYELAQRYDNVTFLDILDYLKKFIQKKNEYDFLNIPAQGDYHNTIKFIDQIRKKFFTTLDKEVRDSLGLVDDRSYEDYVERYIMNVNALIKKEKLKNPVTGKFEVPDEYFIDQFENNISLDENRDAFRSHTISKLGAYSLDNPGNKITYTEVFPNIVKKLQESFRSEQKEFISEISKNLVFYVREKEGEKEAASSLEVEGRIKIVKILENMQKKYKYSELGAITLLQALIKERY